MLYKKKSSQYMESIILITRPFYYSTTNLLERKHLATYFPCLLGMIRATHTVDHFVFLHHVSYPWPQSFYLQQVVFICKTFIPLELCFKVIYIIERIQKQHNCNLLTTTLCSGLTQKEAILSELYIKHWLTVTHFVERST